MSNNYFGSNNNKSNLSIVIAIALVALVGYIAIDFFGTMSTNSNKSYLEGFKTRYERSIHYRFAAIYHGPSMEANHSSSVAVPSVSYRSSGYHGSHAGVGASSLPGAATYSGGSYGGSSVYATSSSQTLHSYGGGSSAGGGATGGGSSRGASVGGGTAGGFASASLGSIGMFRRIGQSSTEMPIAEDVTPAVAGGPRRAPGYQDGDEEGPGTKEYGGMDWVFDGETWEWVHAPGTSTGETYTDPDDGKTYVWNGYAWEPKTDNSEVGTPIGDVPMVLMLLMMAGYLIYRKRKTALASK